MKNEKPRISRLIAIITQLQSKRVITAKEIADKHAVSTRTIYRDIRTLENSGIPVITEEGKGFSLINGYNLPPLSFNEKEANALITAQLLIARNKDRSLIEAYNDALLKIKSTLKYNQKDKLDLLSDRVLFRNNRDNIKSSNLVSMLQESITNHTVCEMRYHSLENTTTSRSIEPFAIYSTQDNWLLIGFCRLRNDFRKFRVDCIKNLKVSNQKFQSHNMTLQDYFENFGQQKNL